MLDGRGSGFFQVCGSLDGRISGFVQVLGSLDGRISGFSKVFGIPRREDFRCFFYCFGCGASGDVINYVRETNGLSFLESVQELADIAGLPMPEFRPQDSAKKERNITFLSCFETAVEFFQKSLKSDQGRKALDYLIQRGLKESIIEEFRLG